MAISSTGFGSGLDVTTIVAGLVSSQFDAPKQRLDDKLAQINTKISSAGKLKSSLSTLQTAFANLADIQKIYSKQTKSSDESILTATASTSKTIASGSYNIEVQKVAQAQSLVSGYINNVDHVGGGPIQISLGKYTTVGPNTTFTPNGPPTIININPPNDSLTAIRDAINNSDAGVTASIVQDDLGSRLTITSNKTGEGNAMRINGIPTFTYDASVPMPPPNGLTQTVPAMNSQVQINGVILQQSTNQLDNAIEGLSLNLKKAAPGATVTVNVSDNKDQVSALIKDFVKKYNDTVGMIKGLTDYNTTTKKSGDFSNDPQLRGLTASLSQLVSTTFASWNTNIKTLADLGITTNKNGGLLSIDDTKLNKALTDNYSEIGRLFAKTATSTDPNIKVTALGAKVPAGTYTVNLTQYDPMNLSGTIGGLPAYASGTTLTGSESLLGLSINVTGGMPGPRGTVTVTDGIASLATTLLDNYTKSSGIIDQNITSLNTQVKRVNEQEDNLATQRSEAQTRYLKQFQALDVLLTQLQSTNSMLTQQLSKL